MRFLLLGKGKSIKYIKKYIMSNKDEVIHAVFEHEYNSNYVLANEKLLEIEDIDYAIKSPGISETNQLYLRLSRKFKFISELDLLSIYNIKTKSIVVTGSNGKTTFVSMLKFLFDKLNIKSIICGNSFNPISKYFKQFNKVNYLIIEQSSFQLHDLKMYSPFISIILNLQENHLDMSYSLNSYFNNKMNIYKYQNKECYFIYDSNNRHLKINRTNANIVELLNYDNFDSISNELLKYKNNINYLYTIFKILNFNLNTIERINEFKQLKYRNTKKIVKDTLFVNDSKSTSVDSILFSLSQFQNYENVILIIGGRNKNLSFNRLNECKLGKIIAYGELKDKIIINNLIKAKTLYNAFNIATNIELAEKIILFSPGCSSFDSFNSYVDRGKYFDRLVKKYEKIKEY